MNLNFKAFLPHLLALGIFLSISVAYFHPALEGYTIVAHDVKTWRGMSKEIEDFREESGSEALWTNSMFGGMPADQISVKHNNPMMSLITILSLGLPRPISIVWLYMLGFYILLLSLKVDFRMAIVGAIAFAFSTYFFVIIQAGHVSKAFAIALMAPILAGVILSYRKKLLLGASLFSIFLGMILRANHLQITYYLVFIILFVVVGEFINYVKRKDLKSFFIVSGVLVLFSVFSILTNLGSLWGTIEYGAKSTRGKSELVDNTGVKTSGLDRDYATAWSYGTGETFSLMLPYVKGGGNLPLFLLHEEAVSEDNLDLLSGNMIPQVKQQVFNRIANETSYWGNQSFTSGNDYVGIIIVFFALLALFYVDGVLKWTLLGVSILAIFLAWGKNMMWFTNLFLDYVPGYNKFRTVSMALVIVEFTLPLLAALFLRTLVIKKEIILKEINKFYIVSAVFIGFLLLLLITPDSFFNFFPNGQGNLTAEYLEKASPDMSAQEQMSTLSFYNNDYYPLLKKVRVSIFSSNIWRGLIFVFLAIVLVFGYLKSKLNLTLLSLGLGILILSDLWSINTGYINSADYEDSRFWEEKEKGVIPYDIFSGDEQIFNQETANHPEIIEKIKRKLAIVKEESEDGLSKRRMDAIRFGVLNLNSNFRVFSVSNPFNESRTSYFYKSIGGYHGAKLKRYQEIIDSCLSRNNQKVLDMLNAKYIVQYQNSKETREQNNTLSQARPTALGNAWFVNNVKIVEDANEEIAALSEDNGFNPAETAIVDKRFVRLFNSEISNRDTAASIELIDYKPNHLTYNFTSKTPQLTIFSEIYYKPSWHAFIDGNPVDFFRANYILRGLEIPKGNHKIEFKYVSKSYDIASWVSPIFFVLILLIFVYSIYQEYKSANEITEE